MTQARHNAPAGTIEQAFNRYLILRGTTRQRARTCLLEFFQSPESDNPANPIDFVAGKYGLSSEEVHLALASLLNDGDITVNDDYSLSLTHKACEGRQ
jgi:hypothetical protein